MDFVNIQRCVAGIVLALAAVGLGLSPVDAAEKESKAFSTRVTAIDFDECEPYQVRAQIMDLHPEKGTIVVAEREIRALDVVAGGNRSRPNSSRWMANRNRRAPSKSASTCGSRGCFTPTDLWPPLWCRKSINRLIGKMNYKPVEASRKSSRKTPATARSQ